MTESGILKLIDLEAIKELKYRYFRALDDKDFELLAETLTEDCHIHYGPMGRFEGRAAFLEFIRPINQHASGSFHSARGQHYALNPEITLHGADEASARWSTCFLSVDQQRNSYLQQVGRYSDRYRRQNGEWRICASDYTLLFHQGQTLGFWTPLFPPPDQSRGGHT